MEFKDGYCVGSTVRFKLPFKEFDSGKTKMTLLHALLSGFDIGILIVCILLYRHILDVEESLDLLFMRLEKISK